MPIFASDLGTHGHLRPLPDLLSRRPQTYYIIATDLRVFGGDNGSGNCTRLVPLAIEERQHQSSTSGNRRTSWTWGDLRQIDMALSDAQGKPWPLSSEWPRAPGGHPGLTTTTPDGSRRLRRLLGVERLPRRRHGAQHRLVIQPGAGGARPPTSRRGSYPYGGELRGTRAATRSTPR